MDQNLLGSLIGVVKQIPDTAVSEAVSALEQAQEVKDSIPADYSALSESVGELKTEITNAQSLFESPIDLENATEHFYINADAEPTNSTNWKAVILTDLSKVKKIKGNLGSNNSAFYVVAFYDSKEIKQSTFISGVKIATSGESIEVDVPSTAVCAAVCTRPNSYAGYKALVVLSVGEIDKTVARNRSDLDSISKYTGSVLPVQFEQGSISSDQGQETSNTKRIRSGFISVDDFNNMFCDMNHRMWFYEYAKDKQYIKGTVETTRTSLSYSELDSNTRFVRIVITNKDNTTTILPTAETGFVCVADEIGSNTNKKIFEYSLTEKMGAYPSPLFTVDGMPIADELVIVGNKMIGFNTGSDDLTERGSIKVRKYENGFDGQAPGGTKWLYHYFGHCNTVDFNKDNGCLIMGNGSGSYSLPGKIIIIPEFESIIENATGYDELTLENTNAIIIDCEEYGLGTKFNVLWGEKNGDKDNIAYLITATFGKTTADQDAGDIGVIRRLLLGMGDNELQYGQFISGKSSSEFNGTFAILETFTQEGTAYKNCCQGSCFYKGKIVCAIGHGVPQMWAMNMSEGKIKRKEYYQQIFADDGTVENVGATGICTDGEKIYAGISTIGVWALNI